MSQQGRGCGRAEIVDANRPASAVAQLIASAGLCQLLAAAVELGIADSLSGAARQPEHVASTLGADVDALRRALRALSTIGFCRERGDGAFELDELGAFFLSSERSPLRNWLIWFTRHQWALWPRLPESIRSGASIRRGITGVDGFAYLQKDSEPARVFNGAMAELTAIIGQRLVEKVDFSRCSEIVDIGGGNGALLAMILAANPQARGVVFDLPHVQGEALARFDAHNLSDRCSAQVGDFFEDVPQGASLYVIKNVLHDWDDAQAEQILRTCRRAMADHSRVLIIERMLPVRMSNSQADRALAWTDLMMMIGPGGRERQADEFVSLLEKSGLRCSSMTGLDFGHSAIEAVPA